MKMSRWWWMAIVPALVACAHDPAWRQKSADRQARFEAAAGAEVNSFRYGGPMYSFEPLSDRQLVVYTRPSEAWLLDLATRCEDLENNVSIGLTGDFGRVSSRFDRVLTRRRDVPCTIVRIRPVDLAALKEPKVEKHAFEVAPRQGLPPTPQQ